jgi:hypothetical protein
MQTATTSAQIVASTNDHKEVTMKTQLRIAHLSLLTILCLALTVSAFAGSTIFSEGPFLGNSNAFFITGPNNPNFSGSFQDVSNGFVATSSATPTTLEYGLWLSAGAVPTTISYEIGTTMFGTQLGSGTVALSPADYVPGLGPDTWEVTIPVTSLAMTAGHRYWISLSNADDSLNSESSAWDVPNGGLGGPAICDFRQNGGAVLGGINGNCGAGGESFTLTGSVANSPQPTPESSSMMLVGSGILGIAGVLRRKLMG